jgi:hypothetical protein
MSHAVGDNGGSFGNGVLAPAPITTRNTVKPTGRHSPERRAALLDLPGAAPWSKESTWLRRRRWQRGRPTHETDLASGGDIDRPMPWTSNLWLLPPRHNCLTARNRRGRGRPKTPGRVAPPPACPTVHDVQSRGFSERERVGPKITESSQMPPESQSLLLVTSSVARKAWLFKPMDMRREQEEASPSTRGIRP